MDAGELTEDNPAMNLHPRSKVKSPDKELDFKRSKNSAAFSNSVGWPVIEPTNYMLQKA